MARPRSRSRQYNRENNVVDFERAREERSRKRQEEAARKRRTGKRENSGRRRVKRNRRIFMYSVIILILLIVVGVSSFHMFQLSGEKRALEKKNAQLTQELKDKKAELANSDDPEYVENLVRKKLHMVYPGEILYLKREDENAEAQ